MGDSEARMSSERAGDAGGFSGSRARRAFRESEKKMVAARQKWCCSSCDRVLESTFQVDHTVPLWDGGADCVDNATAMCPDCHAKKTQRESIDRADRRAEKKRQAAESAWAEASARARREEEAMRADVPLPNGRHQCQLCGARYYVIFRHDCPVRSLGSSASSPDPRMPSTDATFCGTPQVVQERVAQRLRPNAENKLRASVRPMEVEADDNPFEMFVFTGENAKV